VQDVTTQVTINHDVTYVILAITDIDGPSLTPTKSGRPPHAIRMFELLHFGYVAQWEIFHRAVFTTKYFVMRTRQYRDNFFSIFVFRQSTMSCVDDIDQRPY
jgi:hypothetical protein